MEQRRYNVGLDFIRIFAMLAVILVHLTIYLPIPDRIRSFFMWGGAGVQCFFVLSGFLACHSFENRLKTGVYYKKRATRILPAYYVAVIGAMLFHQFVLKDVTADIFGLGWLRYFLGLNTVVPSMNYDLWNNTYGLWTMSCFIWFYIMAPLIFKWVRSLKSAASFFVLSFVGSIAWKLIMNSIFSQMAGIESLDVLTGASPFGELYQFAIGIMVYFILKEEKAYKGIVLLSVISVFGLVLNRNTFIWCSLCGLMIIAFENMEIQISAKAQRFVRTIGKESFHVYLSHLLSFAVAWSITSTVFLDSGIVKYSCWALISAVLVVLLCCVMRACEKIVEVIIRKNKTTIL